MGYAQYIFAKGADIELLGSLVILVRQQQVNPEIVRALKNRGYSTVVSPTRKIVNNFDRNGVSDNIFNSFYSRPFQRVLTHILSTIVRSDNSVRYIIHDRIQSAFFGNTEQIKKAMGESPHKNIFCQHCSEMITSYNIYKKLKPTGGMVCPHCKKDIEFDKCDEKDDWLFFDSKMSYLLKQHLDDLIDINILTSSLFASCSKCNKFDTITQKSLTDLQSMSKNKITEYVKSFYCDKCSKIYNIEESYYFTEPCLDFFVKGNGTWLEWYIKKILEKYFPNCPIEQGIIVKKDVETEVDLVMLKDNELISFSCKAFAPYKNPSYDDISDVLKLVTFSDEIVLISTAVIPNALTTHLVNIGTDKVKVIGGYQIESINRLLI